MTGKEIALMASVLFAFMIFFFSIEHVERKLDDGNNLNVTLFMFDVKLILKINTYQKLD